MSNLQTTQSLLKFCAFLQARDDSALPPEVRHRDGLRQIDNILRVWQARLEHLPHCNSLGNAFAFIQDTGRQICSRFQLISALAPQLGRGSGSLVHRSRPTPSFLLLLALLSLRPSRGFRRCARDLSLKQAASGQPFLSPAEAVLQLK